jgi:beta-lactamase regulating signal transducer with metallopeptidase domain
MTGWMEFWFLQLVGQTLVCLGLGYWLSSRCQNRPARNHLILATAMMAAAVTPLVALSVRDANLGLMAGPAQADHYRLHGDRSDTVLPPRLITNLIAVVWGVLTGLMLLRIAVSYIRGCRLISQSEQVADADLHEALAKARKAVGLKVEPELRTHACVAGPMVWAWSRTPIALIPMDGVADYGSVDWESIFIHELAHVVRRDHLTSLLADLVVCVLFWNPAIWWVRSQLARQSEYVCDDFVAVAGKSPVEFAATLLAVRRESLLPAIPATNLKGGRAWLRARVERLLALREIPAVNPGPVWTIGLLIMATATVCALSLAQTRRDSHPDTSFAEPLAVQRGPEL